MSDDKLFNVLFLCTGNSARSVMGECILNRLGRGRFRAFSAGSYPKGEINLHTIETLKKLNYVTDDLRSKSCWDEFAVPGAPKLQFVFTVCDQAAQEVCPLWPGQPMSAHWAFPTRPRWKATRPNDGSPSPTLTGCSSTGSRFS